MTAADYQLHTQQQQALAQAQGQAFQDSEFLQACKEQLRYYFPDSSSTSNESMNLDYLASTFVVS